jgi:hypothetical protein
MMEIVILQGKTRHGKNRVSQHGERWRVLSHTPGETKNIWGDDLGDMHLESVDCPCRTCEKWGQDARWIFENGDLNFGIVGRELDGS